MTDEDDIMARIKATIAKTICPVYDGDCMAACELLTEASAEIVRLRAELLKSKKLPDAIVDMKGQGWGWSSI